jgi:hypothetical protein
MTKRKKPLWIKVGICYFPRNPFTEFLFERNVQWPEETTETETNEKTKEEEE